MARHLGTLCFLCALLRSKTCFLRNITHSGAQTLISFKKLASLLSKWLWTYPLQNRVSDFFNFIAWLLGTLCLLCALLRSERCFLRYTPHSGAQTLISFKKLASLLSKRLWTYPWKNRVIDEILVYHEYSKREKPGVFYLLKNAPLTSLAD